MKSLRRAKISRHASRHRNRRPLAKLRAGCTLVLIGSLFAVACDSNPSRSPPPPGIQLTFVTQPSDTSSLAVMVPPVEVTVADDTGAAKDGNVSIALDPNYCGATLSGTLTVATTNGVATFMDLVVDLAVNGHRLMATFESATEHSAPFNVTSAVAGESLTEQAAFCITPNDQQDAASLAYVPQDDAFWTADDNLPGVHVFARDTGAFLDTIRSDEFLSAFADAALCDDGDGNPATSCSYANEFEVLAFDRSAAAGILYVINTVNDPNRLPPVDKPAIFRLVRQGCASCLAFDAWQELPGGFKYNAAVVIDGQILVADGGRLYAYDFDNNTVDSQTPLLETQTIRGLAYDDSSLWVLHENRLRKFAWPSGMELADHLLDPFLVDDLSGLEVVGSAIYALEGHSGNPVRRFRETPP